MEMLTLSSLISAVTGSLISFVMIVVEVFIFTEKNVDSSVLFVFPMLEFSTDFHFLL